MCFWDTPWGKRQGEKRRELGENQDQFTNLTLVGKYAMGKSTKGKRR